MGKHIHVHIHTADASGFNEADHPRDHGKFASSHSAAATKHEQEMGKIGTKNLTPSKKAEFDAHDHARKLHKEAAEAHKTAAAHYTANTGHGAHYAKEAHSRSAEANKASQKAGTVGRDTLRDRQAMLREMGSPRYSGRQI